jgi:hypothetical protein
MNNLEDYIPTSVLKKKYWIRELGTVDEATKLAQILASRILLWGKAPTLSWESMNLMRPDLVASEVQLAFLKEINRLLIPQWIIVWYSTDKKSGIWSAVASNAKSSIINAWKENKGTVTGEIMKGWWVSRAILRALAIDETIRNHILDGKTQFSITTECNKYLKKIAQALGYEWPTARPTIEDIRVLLRISMYEVSEWKKLEQWVKARSIQQVYHKTSSNSINSIWNKSWWGRPLGKLSMTNNS